MKKLFWLLGMLAAFGMVATACDDDPAKPKDDMIEETTDVVDVPPTDVPPTDVPDVQPPECQVDDDCIGHTNGEVCDLANQVCVQCTNATHCDDGYICNLMTKTCEEEVVHTCDPACEGDTPHCLVDTCVACLNDTHCGEGYTCNASNVCEEVVEPACDPACEGATPHCLVDTCVECLNDTHCGEGYTCNASNVCEEVVEPTCDPACSGATPHCLGTTCVQCLDDTHCNEGYSCNASNVCEQDVQPTCDINGFTTTFQEGFYADTNDGPLLAYYGESADDLPLDQLRVQWWFDYGANYQGVGTYPVEQNSDITSCGLCVLIVQYDAAGQASKVFFAVDGEIEITAISSDGQPFNGTLHNVRFVEWNGSTDTPVANGQDWCVDGHTWTTTLDGDIPAPPCVNDTDCNDPTGICHNGTCVQCVVDGDCTVTGETCVSGTCKDLSTCDVNGFTPVFQIVDNEIYQGNRYATYYGLNATDDVLRMEFFGDTNPPAAFAPGTIQIGALAIDQNYSSCANCVLVVNDADQIFFAVDGQINITQFGTADGDVYAGTLTNVVLQEVTIASGTFVSTPVPGGDLWCIDSMPFHAYLNVECVGDGDCTDPAAPFCSNGGCVECLIDDDCDTTAGETCLQNVCFISPEGNTCDDAIVLTATATETGSFLGYTHNFNTAGTSGCTGYGATGPDAVFEIELAAGQNLNVSYTLTGGDASLYIVTDCAAPTTTCLVGADNTFTGGTETVSYTNGGATAQTVYVVLDAYSMPSNLAGTSWTATFTLTP